MTSMFKKHLLILCLSATALCCFISCDKDKDEKPKTKRELLQQKWDLVIEYDTLQYPNWMGASNYSVYTGKPGDYYSFGKDDTLTSSINGNISKYYYQFNDSTMTYKLSPYTTINKVLGLTDSSLEIYNKVNLSSRGDAYIAEHYYFKR